MNIGYRARLSCASSGEANDFIDAEIISKHKRYMSDLKMGKERQAYLTVFRRRRPLSGKSFFLSFEEGQEGPGGYWRGGPTVV